MNTERTAVIWKRNNLVKAPTASSEYNIYPLNTELHVLQRCKNS